MNRQVSITTIVPVYNAHAFLRDTIDSVLNQTFTDFELLLIDDASTDDSKAICMEYEAMDSRVRLIALEQNIGAAGARNLGIRQAAGSYIHFLDSDDRIDPDTYQACMDSLNAHPAEAVLFGAVEEYFDESGSVRYTKTVTADAAVFDCAQALRAQVMGYEESYLYGYPWNKLYATAYIKSVGAAFPDQGLNEDILFNIDFFMDLTRLNVLDIAPYHYAHRGNASLTGKFVPEYFAWHRIRIEKLVEQFRYWDMLDDDIRARLGVKYARFILSALERNLDKRSGMSRRQRREWLCALYNDELFVELIPHANGGGSLQTVFCRLLKGHHTFFSLRLAGLIHFVKGRFPVLFAKLK